MFFEKKKLPYFFVYQKYFSVLKKKCLYVIRFYFLQKNLQIFL